MLDTRIVKQVRPARRTPRQVAAEVRALLGEGVPLRAAGDARRRPLLLLEDGYAPRHRLELFDATFYLSSLRENEDLRFFVAYVGLRSPASALPFPALHARLFYKDSSLMWRVATHSIRSHQENWIGKGEVRWVRDGDEEYVCSAEETTNLPLEIQSALDRVSHLYRRPVYDDAVVDLVLRSAPEHRLEPYADFTAPRLAARARRENRIHGGQRVAGFRRRNRPGSLWFAPGFAPDFARGVLEVSRLQSRLYGGLVRKFRILSENRRIQYQFLAAPELVWINPPQALTTELTTYGVRTIDVFVDEELFVPGYEYHFLDESEDPPVFFTQIPHGFAGPVSTVDPHRASAAPWIERMPVVQEFRRKVLRRPGEDGRGKRG